MSFWQTFHTFCITLSILSVLWDELKVWEKKGFNRSFLWSQIEKCCTELLNFFFCLFFLLQLYPRGPPWQLEERSSPWQHRCRTPLSSSCSSSSRPFSRRTRRRPRARRLTRWPNQSAPRENIQKSPYKVRHCLQTLGLCKPLIMFYLHEFTWAQEGCSCVDYHA